jgi:ATP dependent DNA ligase domain
VLIANVPATEPLGLDIARECDLRFGTWCTRNSRTVGKRRYRKVPDLVPRPHRCGLSLGPRPKSKLTVCRDVRQAIRYSPILEASLPNLIRSVKEQGLEGLVAKRRDSKYEPGERSGAWAKMRVN